MKLQIRNLTKTFGKQEVLHGISFDVNSGKALGLLGRNGAGKSTTIRIIMNVFCANSGEVLLDGKPFHRSQYNIGYLPEERGLYPKRKVSDQLIYLAMLRGLSLKEAKERLKILLKKLNVEEYEDRILDTLSKGNQQKIQLAQSFMCDPDILILDEPFSGLDPINAQLLKELVKEAIENNKLVIFSSHQMHFVEEFCDELVILNKGNVVLTGNTKQLQKQFGENQLLLQFQNESEIDLLKKSHLCERVIEKGNGCIVKLKEPFTKNELLQFCVEQKLNLERFQVYEASVEDIFVKMAGDNE